MDQYASIFMLIFAGVLLLYAFLLAVTKDYKMLPYRAQVPVKPKNPKKYTVQLAKVVALVAIGIAIGAGFGLWNMAVGAIVMVVCVIAAIWFGTKFVKDE